MLSLFCGVPGTFVLLAVMMLLAGGMPTGAAAGSQLQPEDLLSLVQIPQWPETPVVISPDGTRLAYVTATRIPGAADSSKYDSRGPGRKQLWIVSTEGGRPVRIGPTSTDNWAPAWSPNGYYLAFYSGTGEQNSAAIWNASTGHVRSLYVHVNTNAPVAKWLAGSTRLLVPISRPQKSTYPVKPTSTNTPGASPTPKITVLTSTPQPEAQTKEHGDVISPATDWGKPFDLSIVAITNGKISTVVGNKRPTIYKLSPDSTKLMYAIETGEVSEDINDRVIFDLTVVDLRSGVANVIAKAILTAYNAETLSWSHDGSTISYVGGNLKDDNALIPGYGSSFPGHLYVVSVTHPGELRRVGDTLLSRFQGQLLWSDDDQAIYGTDEAYKSISRISLVTGQSTPVYTLQSGAFKPYVGKLLYRAGKHTYAVASAADGAQDVYDFDLNGGRAAQVFHRYQNIAKLTFSFDGSRAAYIGQDATRTEDAWVAGDAFGQPHQVTHLNPDIAERALGTGQSVSWQTKDGRTFEGALLLPAGYRAGERYPTIVSVYAGEPEGTRSRNAFGMSFGAEFVYLNLQLYASRGYAVFVPDSELRVGTPMQDIADVILPGVDKIVAMGIADPNRLGVMGQSYGGYSTLALIVQSNRFKAAVATSGIYDIFSFYGTLSPDGSDWTSWSESEQGRMGGTPWQYQQRYIDNSPFFFLDRVQTPVLLEYGSEDRAAAINADEAFIGLRRLGKEATLVRYAGEDHVLIGRANQLDLTHRIFDWFERHLTTHI